MKVPIPSLVPDLGDCRISKPIPPNSSTVFFHQMSPLVIIITNLLRNATSIMNGDVILHQMGTNHKIYKHIG